MRCRFSPSALVLLLGGQLVAGCLSDTEPPEFTVVRPPSCGNGRCETAAGYGENCLNCPDDCDCCAAVDAREAVPTGQDLQFALGQPDQRLLRLEENSELTLILGSEARDQPVGGVREILVHGTVSTADAQFGGCPRLSSLRGAIEVWAGGDGREGLIGIWTSKESAFDLGCASLPLVRYVKLRAQPGAAASLDALTIAPQSCFKDIVAR